MSRISRKTTLSYPDKAKDKVQYLEHYVKKLTKEEIDVWYHQIAYESNLEVEDVYSIANGDKRFKPSEDKLPSLEKWFKEQLIPNI